MNEEYKPRVELVHTHTVKSVEELAKLVTTLRQTLEKYIDNSSRPEAFEASLTIKTVN